MLSVKVIVRSDGKFSVHAEFKSAQSEMYNKLSLLIKHQEMLTGGLVSSTEWVSGHMVVPIEMFTLIINMTVKLHVSIEMSTCLKHLARESVVERDVP